jgi:hypothetical protein
LESIDYILDIFRLLGSLLKITYVTNWDR